MFEDEIKLEKESKALSFKSPFLYIFLVVVLIIAGIGYAIFKSEKDLDAEQAKPVITAALHARGPVFVHFHVGNVTPSIDEKPRDPHYRLLEKLGFVKLANGKDNAVSVTLTPLGEGTLTKLPEFKKSTNPDGTEAYQVPLATRELVAIKSVTMTSPGAATVVYEWKWAPTKVGENFDATSDVVQKFSQWDRAVLIKSYGVDFYKQSQTATLRLVRSNGSWKISEE